MQGESPERREFGAARAGADPRAPSAKAVPKREAASTLQQRPKRRADDQADGLDQRRRGHEQTRERGPAAPCEQDRAQNGRHDDRVVVALGRGPERDRIEREQRDARVPATRSPPGRRRRARPRRERRRTPRCAAATARVRVPPPRNAASAPIATNAGPYTQAGNETRVHCQRAASRNASCAPGGAVR